MKIQDSTYKHFICHMLKYSSWILNLHQDMKKLKQKLAVKRLDKLEVENGFNEERPLIVLHPSQVKELGVVVYNCSCLAEDLGKIFEAYWFLGQSGQEIPSPWPSSYATAYNMDTPLQLPLNGTQSSVYLSVSCGRGLA